MDQKILVSVLMPVFNAEEYLGESLQSTLSQSYRNLEVIIIDDGCTDQSIDIVRSFCDPRIIIIKNTENVGLAGSLNLAIQHASGEYLARMDADDISHPDRIAKQVLFMEARKDIDVLGTSMQYFGTSRYLNRFPQAHAACESYLLFNVCFGHPSVMFRSSVFSSSENYYNPYFKQYSEEYDLWCRLADKCKFYNLADVLLYYRTYPIIVKRDAEEIRRQNSAMIRRNYFEKRLGPISDSDWEVHKTASYLLRCESKEELYRISKWFNEIILLNEKKKAFNQDELRRQLAIRYYEVCYANASLRLRTISIYLRSEWYQLFKPGNKEMLKFCIKHLI